MEDKLYAMIKRHEGFSSKAYQCPEGRTTVGYGRNLDDRGITVDEATYLLNNDIAKVIQGLKRSIDWWDSLDPVRQSVLVDMAFQMGVSGLLKFRKTLAWMKIGKYQDAAIECLKSKWARQTPTRAREMSRMIATGEWQDV